MQVQKNILFLFLALIVMSCTQTSTKRVGAGAMPNEPGKCFAKCLRSMTTIVNPERGFPIYTGSNPSEVTLLTKSIMVEPARTKWIKKKMDNCMSGDPDDCVVNCLIELPATYNEITYLADTTQTKDFVMEYIDQETKEEPESIWIEVLCSKDINPMIDSLQRALIKNGAPFLPLSGSFDTATKKALIEYQRNENLCVGQLSIESLEFLGL